MIMSRKKPRILHYFIVSFLLLFHIVPGISQTYRIDTLDGQTVNTCSGIFYDSGGPADGTTSTFYGNNEDYTVTFCSDNGDYISFDFTTLDIRDGDTLYVFDGSDATAPLLGKYSNETTSLTVTSSGTCLTFRFVSDASYTREGWEASISCATCPPVTTSEIVPSDAYVCPGSTITYSVDNHSGSSYHWTVSNGTPSDFTGGNTIDVTWVSTGGVSGYIKVVETSSCGSKDSSDLIVDIYAVTPVTFTGLEAQYCVLSADDTLHGSPSGGTFSGPGMTDSIFSPSAAGTGTHTITYTYTDAGTGCTTHDSQTTTVNDKPTVTITLHAPTFSAAQLQLVPGMACIDVGSVPSV
jgi:hypothetical protein